jgi:protein O-mannosyl-transferase
VAPLLKWHGGSPLTTFATVPHIWLHYLKLLFLPLTLNADYSGAFSLSKSFFESRALLATLSLTLLVAAILWGLRRGQWLPAFCGFWFIITLLPVSQIFPHPEMVAEHYLYLPSFGFCLLLALMGGCLARRSKGIGYGLMAGLLIFYGVRTVVRNQDWQDEATFWQKTVVTAPTSARAHHNLAVVLKEKGDLQGALLEFQRAAEVNPNYGYSYIGIAEIYFHWTLFKEALIVAQKGVQLQPQWPQAHFILALVYARLGESSKAIPALKQALALRPDYLLASQLLSELCRKRAEPEKACE